MLHKLIILVSLISSTAVGLEPYATESANGYEYASYQARVQWEEAEQACQDDFGGHLMSVHSDKENEILDRLCAAIPENADRPDYQRCWFGARHDSGQSFSMTTVRWTDDSPMDYIYNGHPCDDSTSHECGMYLVNNNNIAQYAHCWGDWECSGLSTSSLIYFTGYVCKRVANDPNPLCTRRFCSSSPRETCDARNVVVDLAQQLGQNYAMLCKTCGSTNECRRRCLRYKRSNKLGIAKSLGISFNCAKICQSIALGTRYKCWVPIPDGYPLQDVLDYIDANGDRSETREEFMEEDRMIQEGLYEFYGEDKEEMDAYYSDFFVNHHISTEDGTEKNGMWNATNILIWSAAALASSVVLACLYCQVCRSQIKYKLIPDGKTPLMQSHH